MPHASRGKAAKKVCVTSEPEDMQQQPNATPVLKTRGNTAPAQKLPSGQKHAEGRNLPPAPITAIKKVPQKSQRASGTSATPLTDSDTLSVEPEMSFGVSANGTVASSYDDASSCKPSSREQASPGTAERGLPEARPPLHPKTFSKHGHNIQQHQTSTPRASDDAAKPGSHHKSLAASVLKVLE